MLRRRRSRLYTPKVEGTRQDPDQRRETSVRSRARMGPTFRRHSSLLGNSCRNLARVISATQPCSATQSTCATPKGPSPPARCRCLASAPRIARHSGSSPKPVHADRSRAEPRPRTTRPFHDDQPDAPRGRRAGRGEISSGGPETGQIHGAAEGLLGLRSQPGVGDQAIRHKMGQDQPLDPCPAGERPGLLRGGVVQVRGLGLLGPIKARFVDQDIRSRAAAATVSAGAVSPLKTRTLPGRRTR